MNILITGAGGQLGRDCTALLDRAHCVHACTSGKLDITYETQARELFTALQPEVVINCAAYTAVDRCEEDRERCLRVNAHGPGVLARLCAAHGCRLLHISTDYVFDGNRPVPQPYREDDPVNPLSAYGRSKLEGERTVARELDNHLILRTAWLFGLGGGNFLKTMLRLSLADPDRALRVVDDQWGSLTWTRTLARQIADLLSSGMTGIVHATAHGQCSWYEGARHFLQAMEIPFSLEPCTSAEYPTPAHRPRNSILDNHRLRAAGLDLMRPWQEEVELFARDHREQLLAEARSTLHSG